MPSEGICATSACAHLRHQTLATSGTRAETSSWSADWSAPQLDGSSVHRRADFFNSSDAKLGRRNRSGRCMRSAHRRVSQRCDADSRPWADREETLRCSCNRRERRVALDDQGAGDEVRRRCYRALCGWVGQLI
jgi:hypothetical protein